MQHLKRSAAKSLVFGGLFAIALMPTAGCARPPAITSELDLEMNPSGRTPLAGLIRFTTDQPTRATLTIIDGEHTSTVTPNDAFVTDHELMVLGLRPGRLNTVEVSVENERGESGETASVDVTTEPLPDYFPPIDVTLSRPARMEPGFTVLPLNRFNGPEPDSEFGLFVAVDAQGEVVWYYEAEHSVDESRRLHNGNILYRHFRTDLYEIDMLGNIVNHWVASTIRDDVPESAIRVDTDTFHHDVLEMPSGNFLALSSELRDVDAYPTSLEDLEAPWEPATLVGDVLVEFERDTGEIVRQWRFFDYFEPTRMGYGSMDTGYYSSVYGDLLGDTGYDWAHSNGIEYDPDDDAAIVSFNHQSLILKLDLSSDEIVWMLGNHEGWSQQWRDRLLEPVGELEWTWHQHAPEITPAGTLLVYDNGPFRALPPNPDVLPPEAFSRAVEYRIDEAAGTVEEVWSYGNPGDDWFFSGFVSDADWLPETENVLLANGGHIRLPDGSPGVWDFGNHQWVSFFEVTHADPAEKVWELVVDDPARGWMAFRAERFASLYP
jgi:arylsulfate sulfotransferase